VDAVTPLKQLRMARLASEYLVRHGLPECACRFDVVAIHFDGSDENPSAQSIAIPRELTGDYSTQPSPDAATDRRRQ
jgi:Holliday junction resolvase-like predicted endonuclease